MEWMVSETSLDWGLAPQCSHPPLQTPPPLSRSFPRCFLPAQWMVTSDCKSVWAQRVHKGPCLFLLSVPLHIWWGRWVRFPSSQQFNSTHVESVREGIISKKTPSPQCPGWCSLALGRLPYAILLEVRVSDGSLAPGRCGRDSPKIPGVVRAWARPRLLIPKPASPFTCPEPHTIPHLAVPRFLAVGPFLMGPIFFFFTFKFF